MFKIFPLQLHHAPGVVKLIRNRWKQLVIDESTITEETILNRVYQTPNPAIIAYAKDDVADIAALIFVEPLDCFDNPSIKTLKMAHLHIILDTAPEALRLARPMFDATISYFFDNPEIDQLFITGTVHTGIHNFLNRAPYGVLSWIPSGIYHSVYGPSDYFEWHVSRPEYYAKLAVVDSAAMETPNVWREEFQEEQQHTGVQDVREHRASSGFLQHWIRNCAMGWKWLQPFCKQRRPK